MQLLSRGDAGPPVAEVRAALEEMGILEPAGPGPALFDDALEQAVRIFQQQRGLITDGLVGPATYRAMRDARWALGDRMLHLNTHAPLTGDDVFALQERLLELGYDSGRADGVFGRQTEQALRSFQRDYGMSPDGMCGPRTLRHLGYLGRKVTGGRPGLLREQERLHRAGPRLSGKRIVIDPGHGGPNPGVAIGQGADTVTEAGLVADIARRLEGRMAAAGMEALLSHGPHDCPTDAERAGFANSAGADVVLSLHVDANASPAASGLAAFHFGTGTGATSTVGEALAGFIHRELLARTQMVDCGVHPRPWELLRLTRMPAVRVEMGYLTNARDRAALLDPGFRDIVAEGILVAVKRLYLLGQDDKPTGTFTFAEVLDRETTRPAGV
jgi:N-acetylmuramoyl-L-alanine amidase